MSIIEPRTAIVRVYVGDFHDRLAELERRAIMAAQSYDGAVLTLDETPEHLAIAAEYDALAAEAPKHRVEIKLQQIGRRASKELRAQHPPRVAGENGATEQQARGDMVMGVNEETFKDALVRASIVEPDLSDDDLDNLSEGAFNALYGAALELTYGFVTDPKADSLVSRLTRRSDET